MHSKIKKSTTLMAIALCVSTQLHTMYPLTLDDAFRQYIQNGNPWGNEEMPILKKPFQLDDLANGMLVDQTAMLLRKLTVQEDDVMPHDWINNVWINDRSTAEYAKTLTALPSTEIKARFDKYELCFDDFINCLVAKQLILKQLKQADDANSRNQLLLYFQVVEKYMITLSEWLTAIRNSGEEHYLGTYCLKPSPVFNDVLREPTLFWIPRLKEHILSSLKIFYKYNLPGEPELCLNTTSMAILRNQLYKGFTDLEYKKTTAYDGPPICRLKFKGEKPRDFQYYELMEALDLAKQNQQKKEQRLKEIEALDLDTESLWQ